MELDKTNRRDRVKRRYKEERPVHLHWGLTFKHPAGNRTMYMKAQPCPQVQEEQTESNEDVEHSCV